ncbi:MAG: exodeoxyribonuclease VII small subunit [archaeon]
MKEKSFEEALEKIDEVITSLEEEDLPLKKKIEKFKEGAELLKFCNKELKESELSIQKILDKDGKIKLEEFE